MDEVINTRISCVLKASSSLFTSNLWEFYTNISYIHCYLMYMMYYEDNYSYSEIIHFVSLFAGMPEMIRNMAGPFLQILSCLDLRCLYWCTTTYKEMKLIFRCLNFEMVHNIIRHIRNVHNLTNYWHSGALVYVLVYVDTQDSNNRDSDRVKSHSESFSNISKQLSGKWCVQFWLFHCRSPVFMHRNGQKNFNCDID